MVFPRADVPQGHENTTTPPPHSGWGRDLEVRGGGGRGIPVVLGVGSWYSRGPGGGGGSWYSRGSGGPALPWEYHDPGPPVQPPSFVSVDRTHLPPSFIDHCRNKPARLRMLWAII